MPTSAPACGTVDLVIMRFTPIHLAVVAPLALLPSALGCGSDSLTGGTTFGTSSGDAPTSTTGSSTSTASSSSSGAGGMGGVGGMSSSSTGTGGGSSTGTGGGSSTSTGGMGTGGSSSTGTGGGSSTGTGGMGTGGMGTESSSSTGTGGMAGNCTTAGDCLPTGNACITATCVANQCGTAMVPSGTAIATQIAGDCKVDQCNDMGAVVSVNDNDDASSDSNACTADTCTNGVTSHPALGSGAACMEGGGTVCNGAGVCVQCVTSTDCASGVCTANVCAAPVVLFTSPSDGATAVLETSPLAVTFSGAMSPASLTAQTTSGPCTGSIQASTDGFTTCLAFATAAPTMSLGDTVATLVAAPGLSYGSTFKIRVTTAATSAGAGPIAAQSTSMTGFTTRVAASLTLNESSLPAEADYCVIQFPKTTLTVQTGTATPTIYGRLFEAGITNSAGAAPGVTAQLGYGPASVNPEWQSGWQFFPATFNVQAGNDDEYQASFTAPSVGNYRYAYRFSQNGTDWTYCDTNGAGANGSLSFEVTQLPSLVVTP